MISRRLTYFFFNDTATTEIYTLSLHDALPISGDTIVRGKGFTFNEVGAARFQGLWEQHAANLAWGKKPDLPARSEEHTSELQSRQYIVRRLLLEKTKTRLPASTSPHTSKAFYY